MRGLKHSRRFDGDGSADVASFTDAWIETIRPSVKRYEQESHLLQMRGLKHYISTCFVKHIVASFTDAWIETDLILTSWR